MFHCACLLDLAPYPTDAVYNINVEGTKAILRACHRAKVHFLIYTSSMDVVFNGKPLAFANGESLPYPDV